MRGIILGQIKVWMAQAICSRPPELKLGPPKFHTKKKGVNYEILEIDENKA